MEIIVEKTKGGGDFQKAPAGYRRAVCCQVIDQGMQTSERYGDKHKVSIVWQIEEVDDNGRRFQLTKWYNLSFHEKSTLCGDVESWLETTFPEGTKHNLKTLESRNCVLQIKHEPRDSGVRVVVKTVMPPRDGEQHPLTPLDYNLREEPVLGSDGYPVEQFP